MVLNVPIAARPKSFDRLRDLLRLIAALRGLKEPLTTPDGLRKALEILLQFAQFAGLDPDLVDRLRTILTDEQVFATVLGIVQYLAGLLKPTLEVQKNQVRLSAAGMESDLLIAADDFFDWLPLILEIVDLLRRLIGE